MWIMQRFLHPGYLCAFHFHNFLGAKKKEEQTAEMAEGSVISDRDAFWGDGNNDDGRRFQVYRGKTPMDFAHRIT